MEGPVRCGVPDAAGEAATPLGGRPCCESSISSSMSISSCSNNPRGLSCDMEAMSDGMIQGLTCEPGSVKIITFARDEDLDFDFDRLRLILALLSLTGLPAFSASIFCL